MNELTHYVVPTHCSWALILCVVCSGRLTRVDLRGAVAKHIKECPQVRSLSKAVKKLENKIVDEHEWTELVENWLAEQQEIEANAPQETVCACFALQRNSDQDLSCSFSDSLSHYSYSRSYSRQLVSTRHYACCYDEINRIQDLKTCSHFLLLTFSRFAPTRRPNVCMSRRPLRRQVSSRVKWTRLLAVCSVCCHTRLR